MHELDLLNGIQFYGGVEITTLGVGKFSGNCRIYLTFTPETVARWPRGKIEDNISNVVSPATKKFIKKYHYAVIGAGLSEDACAAFDSLSKRGLIKTRPISFMAAAYDGAIVDHPGWVPTEVYATQQADLK